ncbi:hypothetical protein ORN01_25280 [Bacillus cereus]|uniref:hypothetical protein n=1 Tax=Bacillus cereus group TaxID=86661 RepID=UPI0022E06446|nr:MULTISPECIES: hypothetical protein [Bacillus cereus group]MDA1509611.1 hypothetical protein [Bacillus cereus group sp. TH36-2LC]MDZ4632272.1 hypothetical protein [Bacillus cereus]
MLVQKDFHKVHYEVQALEKKTGKEFPSMGKGTTQKIYMFSNGYGASVINGYMSFGLDELAVLYFHKPYKMYRSKTKRLKKKMLKQAGESSLSYSTPITDGVKRYGDKKELATDLFLISKLNKAGQL